MHDICEPNDPPYRREIPIYSPSDRIGSPVIKVDPGRIVGVVRTDLLDEVTGFVDPTPTTDKIRDNVAEFLAAEIKSGAFRNSFCPSNRRW